MSQKGSTTKAVVVREFGGPEALELVDLPVPEPGPGQVLIEVAGAAVNPIDISTRSGMLTQSGLAPPLPMIGIGWDVSGRITAIGGGHSEFAVGDAVIGLRDLLSSLPGAYAEHLVLDQAAIAAAPRSVGAVEAATLPLNGLTAARSLALAGLEPGDSLLVTGAAGAVGGFLLELAARRGLRTIAVAAAEDEGLVRGLGADEFVPRSDLLAGPVRALVPGGVDAVIDAAVVGIAAHEALRGGGTFVALVRPFAPPPIRGTRVVVQEVFADGKSLAGLSALVDAGHLTLRVAAEMPLAEAARAHERLAAGGLRGRLVLVP